MAREFCSFTLLCGDWRRTRRYKMSAMRKFLETVDAVPPSAEFLDATAESLAACGFVAPEQLLGATAASLAEELPSQQRGARMALISRAIRVVESVPEGPAGAASAVGPSALGDELLKLLGKKVRVCLFGYCRVALPVLVAFAGGARRAR